MIELTFAERLKLAAFDKILLGTVVGIGILSGRRVLERYRSRQKMSALLARKRVTEIATLCDEMSTVLAGVYRLGDNYSSLMWVAIKETAEALPAGEPYEARDRMINNRLSALARQELSAGFDKQREAIAGIRDLLTQKYFWLGRRIHDDVSSHLDSLFTYVSDLERAFNSPDVGELQDKAIMAKLGLKEKQIDIDRILNRL